MTRPPAPRPSYLLEPESFAIDAEDHGPGAYGTALSYALHLRGTTVGVVRGQLLRFRLARQFGFNLRDVIEHTCQGLHEFNDVFHGEGHNPWREPDESPFEATCDVLFVEALKVVSSHRRQFLGLLMLQRLRDVLLGDGPAVVALRAVPIAPFNESMPEDGNNDPFLTHTIDNAVYDTPFVAEGADAAEKLRAYFARIGMKRMGDTDYMFVEAHCLRRL